MTLNELITKVNYRRRDTTESFVSNDEITNYLNEALYKINRTINADYNIRSQNFSYTDGTTSYVISTIITLNDFKGPYELSYPSNLDYKFTPVSVSDFRKLSGNNVNIYAIQGNTMYIKTSFGSATLQMTYYSDYMCYDAVVLGWRKDLSNLTDYPLMPEVYQDILVDYAAARCYQKEGLLDDYKVAIDDFNKGMKDMKADYPMSVDKPRNRMVMGAQFSYGDGDLVTKSNPLGT